MQAEDAICFVGEKEKRQMRAGTLQARRDDDKEEKRTEQNKTIYKAERCSPQITKHTDIRVRKVWYELKTQHGPNLCVTEFATKRNSCGSGEFELSLTSTQDVLRL